MWKQTFDAVLPDIGVLYTEDELAIVHNRFDVVDEDFLGKLSVGIVNNEQVRYFSYLSPVYSAYHHTKIVYFSQDTPSMYRFGSTFKKTWPNDLRPLFIEPQLYIFDSLKELLDNDATQSLERCIDLAMNIK